MKRKERELLFSVAHGLLNHIRDKGGNRTINDRVTQETLEELMEKVRK